MKPAQKQARAKGRRLLPLLTALCLLLSGVVTVNVTTATQASASAPTPPWWSGACDVNNNPGSYPLGASYNGVQACGPGSYNQGGTDRLVHFFTIPSQAWGEYEWECVELVMRYMYLVYGIAPYNAPGGKDVVANYGGTGTTVLTKVNNDGKSLPSPGDIISVGAAPVNPATGVSPNSYGHTAVVTAVSVDGSGNGTLTDMQQNATSNGVGTLAITGGKITGTVLGGSVTGWLHNPNAGTTPPAVHGAAIYVASSGAVALVATGSAGDLETTWQTAAGSSWSGWVGLGGSNLQGTPALYADSSGRLTAFAIGTDGNLYTAWQPSVGSSWASPVSLGGGTLQGSPAIYVDSTGRGTAFAITTGGVLETTWQTSAGSSWSGWYSLGGSLLKGDPATYTDSTGRGSAFALGSDGHLYTTWQPTAGSSWATPVSLGGSLKDSPLIYVAPSGAATAFVIGASGDMETDWQPSAGSSWAGWYSLGGSF